jgi:magnesium chelatase subunit I
VLQQIARGQRKLAKIEVPEAVMVDAARLCSAVGVMACAGN